MSFPRIGDSPWRFAAGLLDVDPVKTSGLTDLHVHAPTEATLTSDEVVDVHALGPNGLVTITADGAGGEITITADQDENHALGGNFSVDTGGDTDFDTVAFNVDASTVDIVAGSGDLRLHAVSADIVIGEKAGSSAIIFLGGAIAPSAQTAAIGPVGNVVAKVNIYDTLGALVGYFPVYDTIT